jgi:type IV pilus assembly protein PilB
MSRQLASVLQKAGLLPHEEIEQALDLAERRKRSLWDIVLEDKGVSEEDLAEAISTHMHLPRVRLAATSIDTDAVRSISEELARRYTCIPVSRDDLFRAEQRQEEVQKRDPRVRPTMVLAMANPADMAAIQDVEFASGCRVKPVVATRERRPANPQRGDGRERELGE